MKRQKAFTFLEVLLALTLLLMATFVLQMNTGVLRTKGRAYELERLRRHLKTLRALAKTRGENITVLLSPSGQDLLLSVYPKELRYPKKTLKNLSIEEANSLIFTSDGTCIGEPIVLEEASSQEILLDFVDETLYNELAISANKYCRRPEEVLFEDKEEKKASTRSKARSLCIGLRSFPEKLVQ